MVSRIEQTPVLHIRFEGRSFDILLSDLDVEALSTDVDIKRALAGYLNVGQEKFRDYVVDRHETGNLTVRPQAVFG